MTMEKAPMINGRLLIAYFLMAISAVLAGIDIYGRLNQPKVETIQTEAQVCDDRPLMSGTKVECR